jgi:hypothetical protein
VRYLLLLALAVSVVPVPAVAQAPGGVPAYERTTDDLGTWDAVVMGRDPAGRRIHLEGVEINTSGCGGTCVETRLEGLSAIAAPRSTSAWWDSYRTGGGYLSPQTGLSPMVTNPVGESFSARSQRPVPTHAQAPQGQVVAGALPPRTSVSYKGKNRRTVVFYERTPSGQEEPFLHIIYTRRK